MEEENKPINVENGEVKHFTEKDVWDALQECYDPEIPVNIVDLGLVYNLQIIDEKILVQMTLTAPGCGLGPVIANDVKLRLLQIPGVKDAIVEIVWSPMWNPNMMSDAARGMLGF